MKKALILLLAALIVLSLAACGGSTPAAQVEESKPVAEAEQETAPEVAEEPEAPAEEAPTEELVEEPATEATDIVSANGYTVKIVAVHKTVDSNGDPLAAVELEFTNDNNEPSSFLEAGQVTVYQGGVQMMSDELFLDGNYDWDSYYTSIKDGATIPVFIPVPLKSNDPVEVEVNIMNYNTWEVVASAQIETELVD